MKKFLLIAAMAALALGANADGYKLEKVWELNTADVYNAAGVNVLNVRQGFGMNGKFYFNDKNTADGAIPTIYEVDENGLTGVTFEGGRNCGITHDEAGNIIVSDAVFPGGWVEADIKVINPKTGEVKVYTIPAECGMQGRCDFLGIPKGNLMEDGVLYLTGKTSADVFTAGVAVFTVTDGEVNYDECYLATNDAISAAAMRDNMTVVNYYEDISGNPALLFVYRSVGITVKKLTFDGTDLNCEVISLPGKGACNGTFPFIWDGLELFIYPQVPNYLDGFAISGVNAEEPLFVVEPTVAANMNGFQSNWLNAEVDEDGVTIYQYAPGAKFVVYRLTKDEPAPEVPNVYILGEVNEQGWAANAGTQMEYDATNKVYTATVNLDGRNDGFNYFSFTKELANDNDDGGWAYIAPFRFGAVSEGDFWYNDGFNNQPLNLTYDNGQAFRAMAGNYTLTVSLENMTLTVVRNFMRGDANRDNIVNIADVTELINMLLNDMPMTLEADCNLDGGVGIGDVTTLINFLLTEEWID